MENSAKHFANIFGDLTKMGRLVYSQVESALECFRRRDLVRAEEIVERDDVVDNLNLSIEERCFELAATGRLSPEELRAVRSTVKVIGNLERVGDAGAHIAKRVRLMEMDGVKTGDFDTGDLERLALLSVKEALQSFLEKDVKLAHTACLREPELDIIYVDRMKALRGRLLTHPQEMPFLMHCNSVLKYLEKVADYTLNIGEQTIYLVTGRRLKFPQYQQLDRLLANAEVNGLEFSPYWDGVGGAVVAKVEGRQTRAIYKEGSRRKIQQEIDKLEAWRRIASQHAPRVLGFVTMKERQAILREFAEGKVLSELYLSDAPLETKLWATQRLIDAVELVWTTTLTAQAPRTDYVEQIRRRLPELFALHPELEKKALDPLGPHGLNLEQLLDRIEPLQPELTPPFSVWLHGDFNANNAVYQEETGEIKFVDVHRSQPGDYLQDIGVFLVSMERRPELMGAARRDVEAVNFLMSQFARRFGEQHHDAVFERRLSLSLARAYITSGRVIVDGAMAETLMMRGISILSDFLG